MRKVFLWLGSLAVAGLVLGAAFGFLNAGHCIPFLERPIPGATCHRILGRYVSDTTYSTVKMALVGMSIGLGVGIVAAPMILWRRRDPRQAPHLLEYPVVWFGLQFLEVIILVGALFAVLPDPSGWPLPGQVTLWVFVLAVMTAANYAIRRRFIPR